MSIIHVTQISKKIKELFSGLIDTSDIGDFDSEREIKILTRCLSAYGVYFSTGCSAQEAANSIVDGGDDNGIDSINYSASLKQLTIVQSKWNQSGTGEPSSSDVSKFCNGVRDLFNLNFDRFNEKIAKIQPQIEKALEDFDTRYVLILIDTGNQGLAKHSQRLVDDLLDEMNDAGEGTRDQVVSFDRLNQSKIHSSLAASAGSEPIDLEIGLSQWGKISDPYLAFFGVVSAEEVADWYKTYGRRLFDKNLRQVLGSTDVNEEIIETLKGSPEKFWYFNNGITIVCQSVEKSMVGGTSREHGTFKLRGAQVVNGAQTVSTIGRFSAMEEATVKSVHLSARIISLKDAGEVFGAEVTRANNRQNRIENRDFVSQDIEQLRIKTELSIDNVEYNVVRSDSFKSTNTSFDLAEATAALACASGKASLAVQAKREIGKFYENINKGIYKEIFNPSVSGAYVWNCVQFVRSVERSLHNLISSLPRRSGKKYGLLVHGNRILTLILMTKMGVAKKCAAPDFIIDNELIKIELELVVEKVMQVIETSYSENLMGTLFKNSTKCRELVVRSV